MDLRNQEYHGQLSMTGVGEVNLFKGSITGIIGEIMRHLLQANARAQSDGTKEIVIRIGNKPYAANKDANTRADFIAEVESGIDWSGAERTKPKDGEDFESYYARMMSECGMSDHSARFMACDWFDRAQDPELVNWLSDSKAIRFRELNSRDEAYAAAIPTEYPELLHHCLNNYPNMLTRLNLRVA
jgi:hypothetical protein